MKEFEMPVQSIPKDKRFCKCCGQIKKLKYFSDKGEYCDVCSQKMLHTHAKWYAYPMLVIVMILAIVAVYIAVFTGPAVECIRESANYVEQNRLYDAYDSIEEAELLINKKDTALTEKFPKLSSFSWFNTGFRTRVSLYEIMAETDSRIEVGYAIQDDLEDDSLTKGQLKYLQKYIDIRDVYEEVSKELSTITEEYEIGAPEDVPLNEIFKKLDEVAERDKSAERHGYVEYYKASVIQYVKEGDLKDALNHLEKMFELLPDEYSVYLSTLYAYSRKTGDYEKVIEECDKVISNNLNCLSAYSIKTRALINSGEYEKAEAVCEKLKKYNSDCPEYYSLRTINKLRQKDIEGADGISYQGDTANSEFVDEIFKNFLSNADNMPRQSKNIFLQSFDFTMSQAAVMLVMEDYSDARDLMYNYGYTYAYYYSYLTGGKEPLTQGLIDMIYLCSYLDKDKETMSVVTEQLGNYSDSVKQIINGKLTIKDVFIEGKVELF